MRTMPKKTREAFHSSNLPLFSQYLRRIYHRKMNRKTSVQPNSTERNPLPINRPATAYTSIPCRVVLEGPMLGTGMDATGHEVNSWIIEALGEEPVEISVWAEEEDFIQLLVRLSDRVAIIDLSLEDGEIVEEDSLVIREGQWQQPNSIQTRRMPDGFVRFRHRSNEIMLAPRVRSPDWASNLLESWLSEIRGDSEIPKTKQQKISNLKRSRDRVEKLLDQANLADLTDEIRYIEHRLDSADFKLSGANYSSSEE